MEKKPSPQNEPDLNAVKAFILEHVRKHYAQSGEDLLLSNVGWALSNERPDLRPHLGRRPVGHFIRHEMTDQLDAPPNPSNPTAAYVYLKGQQTKPQTLTPTQVTTTVTEVSVKRRKYAHAVFLAFTRPIMSGFKRYLVLTGTLHFRDVAAGEEAPAGSRPIDTSLIVTPSAGQPKAEVQEWLDQRIDQWLHQHKLPLELVVEQPGTTRSAAKGRSLWDIFLAALSEPERKRIQLPLDIVVKLQNTPK
ncbi:hypothetical protein [Comamonas aquatica]|uniref:Uncharacterized protein n=1 Tax=Comamonas aquatica TaxID=225991 RepID=A0AA35GIH6_9BURK|nr:hypothetical protein [Comamonas aquatica]CAB5695330.1 Uncharacterised protein [Comamonas aquatica]CAC9684841.1 Uncharacterised protein [Comamonas aquatica]